MSLTRPKWQRVAGCDCLRHIDSTHERVTESWSTARHLPYSVQQEKHNVSLVQCTQPDGELKVVFVNWADISALYGQFLFLDERNRIKSSVFSAFPYHRLEAVVFIVPDTGVYPRKWHHTERPELDADTLRLKDMWNAAIANRKAPP